MKLTTPQRCALKELREAHDKGADWSNWMKTLRNRPHTFRALVRRGLAEERLEGFFMCREWEFRITPKGREEMGQ